MTRVMIDTEDKFLIWVGKERKKWIRVGECKQCGKCCARAIKYQKYSNGSVWVMGKARHGCPQYNKKTKKCKLHGCFSRMMICSVYPWSPYSIPKELRKTCGYKFKRRKKI